MKKYETVKTHQEFDDIIASSKYLKGKYIIIYNKENNYPYSRFGIAVGKKIGNAVMRNKMKRIYRMIIHNNKKLFKNKEDYIIIVKRSSLDANFNELELDLVNLMKRRNK